MGTQATIVKTSNVFNDKWRTGWDSNPRWAFTHGGFQDRCLKPLGHLSSARQDAASGGRGVCHPILRSAGRIGGFPFAAGYATVSQ